MQAKNYQELADSPFIASKSLLHESYQLDGIDFHLWFQGPAEVDLNKIITDFKAFTREQIESFGLFPAPEYHFLFQISLRKLLLFLKRNVEKILLYKNRNRVEKKLKRECSSLSQVFWTFFAVKLFFGNS